jgi:flagellar biosynthesis protein FlhG
MEADQYPKHHPSIWAVGGGKGGVGKSVISMLLSLALARCGQRTVLVDADLGGANLHTLMGIKTPARTLNDYLSRRYETLEEVCVRTDVKNLELICGASEILSFANPQFAQKTKMAQSILNLGVDQVVLDLGAGASYNVLDFYLISQYPIVVLTAQPTSIQNAYGFIRNTVYRKLSRIVSQKPSMQEVVQKAMDPKNNTQMRTIADLCVTVRKSHGEKMARYLTNSISKFKPLLITNMVRNPKDSNAGRIVQLVAEKYLTLDAQELGIMEYDPLIEEMINKMVPLTELPKYSRSNLSADRMVQKRIGRVQDSVAGFAKQSY